MVGPTLEHNGPVFPRRTNINAMPRSAAVIYFGDATSKELPLPSQRIDTDVLSHLFFTFFPPYIYFVGHVIGSGCHGPNPQKVKVVEQIKEPHTKSDLRKIIGLFSYFCVYLTNFAPFIRSLTNLTCNNMPNTLGQNWTEEHKRILDELKQMLINATKLHVAQYGKPYGILVDASKTAVGNCVSMV